MLASPYLLPALLLALIMCSFKNYYQAICFAILAVYIGDDFTFYTMAFVCFIFTVFARIRAFVVSD